MCILGRFLVTIDELRVEERLLHHFGLSSFWLKCNLGGVMVLVMENAKAKLFSR